MRTIKYLAVASFVAASALGVTAAGDFGAAHAKAHAKKGKPGSCGKFFYYDKKLRLCIDIRTK